jgi:hypothetical protein
VFEVSDCSCVEEETFFGAKTTAGDTDAAPTDEVIPCIWLMLQKRQQEKLVPRREHSASTCF